MEDVLTSGLSAKLMRYLRTRVLGETTTSQKDASYLADKNAASATGTKGREESRGRFRHAMEATHVTDLRIIEDGSLDDQGVERDHDRSISRQLRGETCWIDGGEPPNGLSEGVDICDADADGEDRWHGREIHDVKTKFGDIDENGRDDSSRRRVNRGWARSKGKGREGAVDNELALTTPGSGSRSVQVRSNKDRSLSKTLDTKRVLDAKKVRVNVDDLIVEREDNDECFQGCEVGSMDFSDMVKKAVRAAEDEAKKANAPAEAIKAAGDAAAEVVKSAALEVIAVFALLFFLYSPLSSGSFILFCNFALYAGLFFSLICLFLILRNLRAQAMKKLQF